MEDIIMTEKNLIPLLRFPKFVRDAEWICTTLRAEMDYENGVAHENDIDSLGKYIVVNSKFISTEGQIEKRSNNAHCLAEENDILMVLSDLPNGKAIAKCFYVDASNKYTVNQRICKLRSKGANSKLLYYLLNRNPYFLSFDDGVKQTNLKKDEVLSCPLIIPKSIEEQQKIAECLSSIDSYISSINEKVEQLKVHKKSLLQKLFPQNGKNVPEYRFPEYKTDEDWTTNRVGESFKLQGGFAFKSNKFITAGIPVIRISNIPSDSLVVNLQNCVFYEGLPNMHSYTANDGDLLIAMSGATTGKTAIYRGKKPVYVNQRVGIFKLVDNSIYYPFICQWIRTDLFANQIKKILAAGAQPNISSNDIESLLWQHPQNMKEQIQIASCLSTIDDLIDAYKNKLIYIENYKKGLIQQLFPINR